MAPSGCVKSELKHEKCWTPASCCSPTPPLTDQHQRPTIVTSNHKSDHKKKKPNLHITHGKKTTNPLHPFHLFGSRSQPKNSQYYPFNQESNDILCWHLKWSKTRWVTLPVAYCEMVYWESSKGHRLFWALRIMLGLFPWMWHTSTIISILWMSRWTWAFQDINKKTDVY